MAEFTRWLFRCRRDDGLIFYLNGREIRRHNMCAGAESFTLCAASGIGGDDEQQMIRIPLEEISLHAGEHVLAISLHNASGKSSDLHIGGITLIGAREDRS